MLVKPASVDVPTLPTPANAQSGHTLDGPKALGDDGVNPKIAFYIIGVATVVIGVFVYAYTASSPMTSEYDTGVRRAPRSEPSARPKQPREKATSQDVTTAQVAPSPPGSVVCFDGDTGAQVPCEAPKTGSPTQQRAKLPLEMSWHEAETFLRERGVTDIRQGRDGVSLRGANPGAPTEELFVFDFESAFSEAPPTCIGLFWFRAGDWRSAVAGLTGADATEIPKAAERGAKAYPLESSRGRIWVRVERNPDGEGVSGVMVGPKCE